MDDAWGLVLAYEIVGREMQIAIRTAALSFL